MSGTGSLLIAIPTYNERDNVGALLPALLARYPDANVVVIDDNSPDGTGDIVAALARGDRRIHLIRRDRKRGLGSAYRAAFAWALEREYARVVVMDADYSHDPAEIARLLEAADRADIVVGSRYVPGGLIENWPWSRRALSGGANLLARLLVGREVHDWTAGFKCYSRDALASPELESIGRRATRSRSRSCFTATARAGRFRRSRSPSLTVGSGAPRCRAARCTRRW